MLLAAHAALAWFARGSGIFSDAATYVSLARALREFHYRELFRIDLPVHAKYPPGYPMLLAGWSAVGGEQFDWLVLLGIACSAGALLLFFLSVRSIWGNSLALAALAALSFNPALIEISGWLRSEPPFMLFAALTLWAVTPARPSARRAMLGGAAAIAAVLTRSVGATIVIALAIFWIWQRRYRTACVFSAVAGLTVGGWLVFTALAPEQVTGGSYLADAVYRPPGVPLMAAAIERVAAKLQYGRYVYSQLPLLDGPDTRIDIAVGGICAATMLVGLACLWRKWPAALVYLATYGALLMVWPWTLGRFITPVMPWIVLTALLGVEWFASGTRPVWRTATLAIAASVLAAIGLVQVGGIIQERASCDRDAPVPSSPCVSARWADLFVAVNYMRTGLPANAIVVSGAPSTVYLHTGFRSVSTLRLQNQTATEFLASLPDAAPAYVLLAVGRPSAESFVRANCRQIELEASFPLVRLFRVGRHDERVDGAACAAAERFIELSRWIRN